MLKGTALFSIMIMVDYNEWIYLNNIHVCDVDVNLSFYYKFWHVPWKHRSKFAVFQLGSVSWVIDVSYWLAMMPYCFLIGWWRCRAVWLVMVLYCRRTEDRESDSACGWSGVRLSVRKVRSSTRRAEDRKSNSACWFLGVWLGVRKVSPLEPLGFTENIVDLGVT